MNVLDENTQVYAVEKVLEEMKRVEKWAESCNASWSEYLYDAHSLTPISRMALISLITVDGKRIPNYGHEATSYSTESIGIPLARRQLIGSDYSTGDIEDINRKYTVEFGRVDWIGMTSNNHYREFSFKNNGSIKYSRFSKSKGSYRTKFNVLDDDFEMLVSLENKDNENNEVAFILKDGVIIERLNDSVVKRDLNGLLLSAVSEVDGSSIAEEKINEVETRVRSSIKNIMGEIPLTGLVERMSSVLSLLDGKKRKGGTSKALKMMQGEIKQD